MAEHGRTGHHEDLARSETVKGGSDRAFGLVFTVVFAIVAGWPLLDGNPLRWWALVPAAGFLAAALIRPALLAPLNRLWTRFGLLLHRVVNPLVMGVMFFLLITPMGLALRLLGKDPMRLRRDPAAASYWIAREPPGPAPETMKQQF